MYIFGYLRASTHDRDVLRAKERLKSFVLTYGHRVAGWYIENASGESLHRPELMRLLNDAESGDLILVEQVDRLSRRLVGVSDRTVTRVSKKIIKLLPQ
ncbi:recombinase family protein [Xenorhabdus innexi]|uniref:Serine recombinase n=1 Tax=Xenorhabdus innexi TaxID=290109 RepID=A0A1N6MT67_9GAMM|nr:recombinase family protein [Xenorhabdus innexi]PHM30372.1 serine recombinase [Xenorhabdus innexi]SIP71939.1 hypothetical protein XIS1_130017 [Xenorhabdus innexi]